MVAGRPASVPSAAPSRIFTGWGHAGLPAHALGYVYLPAFAGISLSSIMFARIGVRLAHQLPGATLKKVFAILLVFVGIKMIAGSF